MARSIISLSAMEKLLKKCGAPRVSENAKQALSEALEELGKKIGERSINFANHSGRKTIKAKDIKLALKESNI